MAGRCTARVSVSELRAQQHTRQNRILKSYPVTYTQCKARKQLHCKDTNIFTT
uniref:Uncharacterized protein n=1 Tax=Klebsiella pneumoniae TaxID=573 RepID=U3PFB8_KLEPN|nr:hypothetical protein [Klebsiella pneumoniae]